MPCAGGLIFPICSTRGAIEVLLSMRFRVHHPCLFFSPSWKMSHTFNSLYLCLQPTISMTQTQRARLRHHHDPRF